MSNFLPDGSSGGADISPAVSDEKLDSDISLGRRLLQALAQRPERIPSDFVAQIIDLVQVSNLLIPLSQIVGYAQQTQATHAHLASDQTISNAAARTVVTFDTTDFDYGNLFNTTSHKITPTLTGKYQLTASLSWIAIVTGSRYAAIRKNGSIDIAADSRNAATAAGFATDQTITTLVDITLGDYFEVVVIQTSGGNLALDADDGTGGKRTNFSAVRVGP